MMEIRVAHRLDPDAAAERLADVARANDIALELDDGAGGRAGRLAKTTPLGEVSGRFVIEVTEVLVRVERKPAFLPEGTVRRLLEENLGGALSE